MASSLWTLGGSIALPSQISRGPRRWGAPVPTLHRGPFPTMMACGWICWPLLVTCSPLAPGWLLHGRRCLIRQVGPSWGGHGGGTQGLGGHMASSLPGEPVPVGSRGTAVPTRLAVISSSRGTCSRPRGDGARPASSLPGLKHNPVSTHGSPWGQHVFFQLTASG